MEEINIILSIIDKYKEQLKDNDYKICMETLMKIYKKKTDDVDEKEIFKNSNLHDFRYIDDYLRCKILFPENVCFIHRNGLKYLFNQEKYYKKMIDEFFIITKNDNDIISLKILKLKLKIDTITLKDFMINYYGSIKPIYHEKSIYPYKYSGIKLRQ